VRDLLDFYAARHAQDEQEPISFAPDLLQALLAYAWPGNVRELSNLVDRFTTLFPARRVTLAEIPLPMLPPGMRPRPAVAASAVAAAPVIMPATASVAPVPPLAGDEMIFTLLGESGLPPAPALAAANAGVMSMPYASDLIGAGTPVQVAPPEAGLLGMAGGDSAGLGATTEAMGDEPLNRVEEIVCLAQGIVSLPPEGLPLKQQLTKIERSLIEQALLRTNGNVSQTARLLQLQRTTLIEKIQKYELRVG